jgi:hypothetical protein
MKEEPEVLEEGKDQPTEPSRVLSKAPGTNQATPEKVYS